MSIHGCLLHCGYLSVLPTGSSHMERIQMVQPLLFPSLVSLSLSNLQDYNSNGSNMDSKDAMDMAMMSSVTVFKRQWVDGRPDGGAISNEEVVSAGVGTHLHPQIVRLQKLIGFAGRREN